MAAFVTAGLFWKLIVKEEQDFFRIFITGLLTGTVSHYITFLLVSIGMNICYLTTEKCAGSLGEPPASVLLLLKSGFVFSFFSLMFFGWITAPCFVIIGVILKRLEKKNNVYQNRL